MRRLSTTDADFETRFTRIVNDRREADDKVEFVVREIIDNVRRNGDAALRDLTMRYDKHALTADTASWRIGADECRAAFEGLTTEVRTALELAATRIRAYHEAQLPENRDYRDSAGVRLGARWGAVEAAGLYVPGGRASYPSTLLMNAIPQKLRALTGWW